MELFPDTLEILASKLLRRAYFVLVGTEFPFVAAVAAIVVVIAQPVAIQATSVVASELIVGAGYRGRTMMERDVLVSSVNAIGISVTEPFFWYTLSTAPNFVRRAGEFGLFVALPVVWLRKKKILRN